MRFLLHLSAVIPAALFLISMPLGAETINLGGALRNVGLNPLLFGADTSGTTSVQNGVLTHVNNNNRLIPASAGTRLVLQDVTLSLDATFSFTLGALEIIGDVRVRGPGRTFVFNAGSLFIRSGSSLTIGPDITFEYSPTGSSPHATYFEDASSSLIFDNSTFALDMSIGMRLSNGNLVFSGDCTLTNVSTSTTQSLTLGSGVTPATALISGVRNPGDCALRVVDGGTLTLKGAGVIVQNLSKSSLDIHGGLNVRPSSQLIFTEPRGFASGRVNFTAQHFTTTSMLDRVTGSMTATVNQTFGITVNDGAWSPDGTHIAVGGAEASSGNELQVYRFDGSTLTLIASEDVGVNAVVLVNGVSWSPDGRYLALCAVDPGTFDGGASTAEIQVYSFDGTTLAGAASADFGGASSPEGIEWSPNGQYLAVAGAGSSVDLEIHRFTGSSLILLDSLSFGNMISNLAWRPDGRFLLIGGLLPDSGQEIQLFEFSGDTLVSTTSTNYGMNVQDVAWSPSGAYFACLGTGGDSGHDEFEVYSFDGKTIAQIATDNVGAQADGVTWSPDGRYIAFTGLDGNGIRKIVEFNGATLTPVISEVALDAAAPRALRWSPCGKFLMRAGLSAGSISNVAIYRLGYTVLDPTVTLSDVTFDLTGPLSLGKVQLNVG